MRKMLLVFILCAVAVSAAALSISVKLESSTPVGEQVAALEEYIAQLPENQREAWLEGLDALVSDQRTVYSLPAQNVGEDIVYIADTGKRYHQDNDCRGLSSARTISAVTKEVAFEMGRTPCKLCYPNGDPQ